MSPFITFEGGEGCGKSTQSKMLRRRLSRLNLTNILVYEPGFTQIGERVRKILKQAGTISISPLTELMLFNAARSQLVTEVIQPALNKNIIVVCDRFTDSTIAYQSYGRGLERNLVEKVNLAASQDLKPGLTILLDIPPEKGLNRKKAAHDRFEQETLLFHEKVRNGFLILANEEPERWLVIDATLPRAQIADLILERVIKLAQLRRGAAP